MNNAKFILYGEKVKEQVKKLLDEGLKISYSYKTNKEVGNVLQEICPEVDFSIHAEEEINEIKDKNKIWFFTQAESEEQLREILEQTSKATMMEQKAAESENLENTLRRVPAKIYLG